MVSTPFSPLKGARSRGSMACRGLEEGVGQKMKPPEDQRRVVLGSIRQGNPFWVPIFGSQPGG